MYVILILPRRSMLGMHLKAVHKVTKGVEGEHMRTVKETSIDCQLCSLSVLKTEAEVRKHLSRFHDLNLEEYAARFVHGGGSDGAGSNHFLAAPTAFQQTTNEDVKVPKNVMW